MLMPTNKIAFFKIYLHSGSIRNIVIAIKFVGAIHATFLIRAPFGITNGPRKRLLQKKKNRGRGNEKQSTG